MEAMKHYGWSLTDSHGIKASILVFQSHEAADQYRMSLTELHPQMECSLVELFVKHRNG